MRALYKYPQAEFPYQRLVEENARRTKLEREFEIEDTGVFDESRYFDVIAEYAKAAPDDMLIRLTLANRGPEAAPLHVLPTLWFRNTWSWGCTHEGCALKPRISMLDEHLLTRAARDAGHVSVSPVETVAPWLFTENETNNERLFGTPNLSPYVKDAFHEAVIHGRQDAVNPQPVRHEGGGALRAGYSGRRRGGRCACGWRREPDWPAKPFADFDADLRASPRGGDAFYETKFAPALPPEQRNVVRQAYAGLLWTKQFYHYVVKDWLAGDPELPPPPAGTPAAAATATGGISSTRTSSPCRTSGNIRGMRRGISRFT